jgi:DNA-binding transcriptional LysR family regulator
LPSVASLPVRRRLPRRRRASLTWLRPLHPPTRSQPNRAVAADHPIAAGSTIPFVSFDENCFYRQAAQQALAGSGRKLDVVLECPSAEGVKAGVRHGLGIGLIGRRILSEGLSVITADLPAFPQVCHVLRWRVGLPSDLQKSLTDAVLHEMLEPGSEFTSVAA